MYVWFIPMQNDKKQGDAMLLLLFKFTPKYVFRHVKDTSKDWNEMGHISFRFVIMTLIYYGEKINIKEKNTVIRRLW